MKNRNLTLTMLALCFLVAFSVIGCSESTSGPTEPQFDPNDTDGDGVVNASDNCPNTANPTQADSDGDGTGDACESAATCTPPTSNDARVEVVGGGTVGVCPATGPCLANGVVTSGRRTIWTNSQCTPRETDDFNPSFNCPAPGTYVFNNKICNSTAAEDPQNLCCRDAAPQVTFTASSP